MRGGDELGCAVLILFVGLVLLSVVVQHPWVLVCLAGAGIVYMLIKREQRRDRQGDDRQPPKK
jgi:threonine/homoserine/homoserine lactone efflux protein